MSASLCRSVGVGVDSTQLRSRLVKISLFLASRDNIASSIGGKIERLCSSEIFKYYSNEGQSLPQEKKTWRSEQPKFSKNRFQFFKNRTIRDVSLSVMGLHHPPGAWIVLLVIYPSERKIIGSLSFAGGKKIYAEKVALWSAVLKMKPSDWLQLA